MFESLADFMERLSVLYQSYNNYLKEQHTIQNNVFKVSKKLSASPRDIVSFTQRVENLSKRIDTLSLKAEILFNESKIIKEKYAEFVK